jgi:hypothetical protein
MTIDKIVTNTLFGLYTIGTIISYGTGFTLTFLELVMSIFFQS